MKNYFHKEYLQTITVKILVIMILLVLPLNIWGILSTSQVQSLVTETTKESLRSVGQLVVTQMDDSMDYIDEYLFNSLVDNTFFLMVARQEDGDDFTHAAINLHDELSAMVTSYDTADAFFFYSKKLDYFDIAVGSEYLSQRTDLMDELKEIILDSSFQKSSKWQGILLKDGEWQIRIAMKNDLIYGALVSVNAIKENIVNRISYESTAVVSTYDALYMAEDGEISAACQSENSNLVLNVIVDSREIQRSLPIIQRFGWGISILFLIVLPVITFFLHHIIFRPTKTLVDGMLAVSKGNDEYRIEERAGSREFTILYDNFNHMVSEQKRIKLELVEKETYSRKLELQNLQIQLRPHFVLNTFNLLYGLVSTKKTDSAQKMILYLSSYFRYLVGTDREMDTYSNELDLIKGYVDMARLRFPFIAFEEKHDEAVLEAKVPVLLIHNFVENAIKHGMRVGEVTHIELRAHIEEEFAFFCVEDDGIGMEKSKAEQINRRAFDSAEMTGHIGVKNSWQRIAFYYGDKGDLHVTSEPGKGTKMEIRFPALLQTSKGEENEGADSGR